MKHLLRKFAASFSIAAVCIVSGVVGAEPAEEQAGGKITVELVGSPDSTVTLEGNSTLHRFESTSKQVQLRAVVALSPEATELNEQAARASRIEKLELTLPVESLKSGNTGLDDKMYEALKQKKYPVISFALTKYAAEPSDNNGAIRVSATGRLTVAGEQRPVQLNANLRLEKGALRATGSTELLMTDFAIEPPTFFLGAMRTDNKIVIRFDVALKPRASAQLNNVTAALKVGAP